MADMKGKIREKVMDLPKSSFARGEMPKGFGMDIGGSLVKVAYATQQDDDKVQLHFLTYDKDDLPASLPLLRHRLAGCRLDQAQIFTTGVGCNQFKKLIDEGLSVNIQNLFEMVCQTESLKFFLKNLPKSEYIYPRSEKIEGDIAADLAGASRMHSMMKLMQENANENMKMKLRGEARDTGLTSSSDMSQKLNIDDVFPSLLCTLGSGCFYTVVAADGANDMVDINTSCGRMFMGLGSILTGAKTFDELVGLAEVGVAEAVETRCKHVRKVDSQDVYALLPDDTCIYCFGQASGRDLSEFRKEDVAAALVSQLAQQLSQSCHLANMASDVKTVMINGSMCENEIIRNEFVKHFTHKSSSNNKDIHRDFYVLKNGSHLGALGCLLAANAC